MGGPGLCRLPTQLRLLSGLDHAEPSVCGVQFSVPSPQQGAHPFPSAVPMILGSVYPFSLQFRGNMFLRGFHGTTGITFLYDKTHSISSTFPHRPQVPKCAHPYDPYLPPVLFHLHPQCPCSSARGARAFASRHGIWSPPVPQSRSGWIPLLSARLRVTSEAKLDLDRSNFPEVGRPSIGGISPRTRS